MSLPFLVLKHMADPLLLGPLRDSHFGASLKSEVQRVASICILAKMLPRFVIMPELLFKASEISLYLTLWDLIKVFRTLLLRSKF
jgi:hypothetical protein